MRQGVIALSIGIAAAILGWLLFVELPRRNAPRKAPAGVAAAASPAAPATPGRKIKARLFYVADDGIRLTSVEREVPYGDGTLEQARQIVAAEIAPVTAPTVSPIPAGTTLRALFMNDRGQAFVDLSRDVASAHPGGTVAELLTIYAIVDALTVNLPAVTAVQLLVDGKEVETLVGHVDLRRPLARNLEYVQN